MIVMVVIFAVQISFSSLFGSVLRSCLVFFSGLWLI
jgi:hypothetical protein